MTLPKIRPFTFEDWKEDNLPIIEFSAPTEYNLFFLLDTAKSLGSLTYEDFSEIRQCQDKTHDMAVEMFCELSKEIYLLKCKMATDSRSLDRFKKEEDKRIEKELNKDENLIQDITIGFKDSCNVTGGTFKKVEAKYQKWKNGKLNEITARDIPESGTFPLSAYIEYSDWLNDQNVSEQPTPLITIDPARVQEIINDLSLYLSGQQEAFRAILTNQVSGQKIQFSGNQKKLVLSFRKYKNGNWINGNQRNLTQWLCDHFTFIYEKGNIREIRDLNSSTVKDYLSKEEYLKDI